MSDLYVALDSLELPTIFFCERLPWLPEDRELRHALYYTPDGEPITHGKDPSGWVDSVLATTAYKMLEENRAWTSLTFQGQDIEVATDYIGESAAILGHRWPVIFETMIFTDIPGLNNWCRRYITRSAAMYGHKVIVGTLFSLGASLVEVEA